jgi:hypothetical protein
MDRQHDDEAVKWRTSRFEKDDSWGHHRRLPLQLKNLPWLFPAGASVDAGKAPEAFMARDAWANAREHRAQTNIRQGRLPILRTREY